MKNGFTLIETMIVISLSLVMFGALVLLIYNFNTFYTYEQATALSSGSVRTIMGEAELLVLPSDRVLLSHSFSGTEYTSSSTVLVLGMPSIDSSGGIVPGAHDYAVFYSDGAQAYRIIEANPASTRLSGTRRLSNSLSSMTFAYNNADFALVDAVTIDVQVITTNTGGITTTDQRSETLQLRNFIP